MVYSVNARVPQKYRITVARQKMKHTANAHSDLFTKLIVFPSFSLRNDDIDTIAYMFIIPENIVNITKIIILLFMDTRDEEQVKDEVFAAYALGGVAAPYISNKAVSPIGSSIFRNPPLQTDSMILDKVEELANTLNVPVPEVAVNPELTDNAFFLPRENLMVLPAPLSEGINGVHDRILAHEMGHAANSKTFGKFYTPYLAFRGYGKFITAPTGAAIVTIANPDSIKAKAAPYIAASPFIATTVEEGIATGRGLKALWSTTSPTNSEKLKDVAELGKALLTYAAPAIGMVGALEMIRRYRSYKKRNPEGTFGKFFLRRKD